MDLVRLLFGAVMGQVPQAGKVDTGPPGFGGPPLIVDGLQKEVAATEPKPQAQILDLLERALSTPRETGSVQHELLASLGELNTRVETPDFNELLAALGLEVPVRVDTVPEFKVALAGAAVDALVPASVRADFARLVRALTSFEGSVQLPTPFDAAEPRPVGLPTRGVFVDAQSVDADLAHASALVKGKHGTGIKEVLTVNELAKVPIPTKVIVANWVGPRPIERSGSFDPSPVGPPVRVWDGSTPAPIGPPLQIFDGITPSPVGPPVQVFNGITPAPVGPPVQVFNGITPAPVGPPVRPGVKPTPVLTSSQIEPDHDVFMQPRLGELRATEVRTAPILDRTHAPEVTNEKLSNAGAKFDEDVAEDLDADVSEAPETETTTDTKIIESPEKAVTEPVRSREPIDAKPTVDTKEAIRHQLAEARRQAFEQVEELVATRGNGRVTIRLNPEELGSLTVAVTSIGESVETKITASNEQVRHSLHTHRADLIQTIESRGLTMSSFSVGHEANADQQGQQRQGHDARQDFARSHNLAQHSRHDETTRPTYTRFAHAGVDTLA